MEILPIAGRVAKLLTGSVAVRSAAFIEDKVEEVAERT